MTIPSHFPDHWKSALATGVATGFRTAGDMVSFFYKARFVTALFSQEEKHYLDLADRHPEQYAAALAQARAEDRAKFETSEAMKRAPFDAAEPGKPATTISKAWDKAIAKTNEGFNDLAAGIYARRNK
ncbi:hypothetical protein X766_31030 [Mesorhizobium sp. LSJC255A00]|uniref:hypothetical protein n=1 Tax=Mesorhizobium sp. LSJC255A00 TaxID=1287313 RepID=UPI0003CEB0CB|nr:hypothetical protein [Mesorhizobium sp. LSJC255A00]ESX12056.1 hypothetical protein X766_31030 [Mesorhizobium sp. LSJC255A00]